MQQQLRQPFRRRARAEHLRQRRIALALETEAFDNSNRKRRDRYHHPPQYIARQMQHRAVDGGLARPDMQALLEHFGAADEIAGVPIGERDLASRGRGVEYLDAPAFDQIDAILRAALAEELRAAIEHLALA